MQGLFLKPLKTNARGLRRGGAFMDKDWLEWLLQAKEGETRELSEEDYEEIYNEVMGDHGQG